ncbi:MAG TPA: chloride channel protein, partial [Planctomycetota bacterium]|nr:chloride channel protein [Planctomycetota bacterium]
HDEHRGAAAGMAGAYNAPIGAAMFVMEVILGSFVMEQFAPVMVSSVISTLTVRAVQGGAPVYTVPVLSVGSPWEALPIFVLGILSALAGWLFLHALEWFEDGLHSLRLPRGVLAVAGGLLVGAMGIFLPEVWGNGFDAVSERILPVALPVGMLALLMVAKTVATGITAGSGISGGVFTPTLFVGAALGAAFGGVVAWVFPESNPSLYALLGMGSVLAATTHAPLMSILILFEMTHDPPLIAPLMLGTVTATVFARWIRSDSLYTARLKRRGIRLPEGAEEAALLRTYARDLVRTDAPVLPAKAPLDRVLDVFLNSRRGALYVVGDGGRYLGVARIHDVKAVFGTSPEEAGGIVALDVAVPLPAAAEDETIGSVLARFSDRELDEVPVVASATDPRFVGSLSRRDILAMLRHEVLVEPQRPARTAIRVWGGPTFLELPEGWTVAEVAVAPEDAGTTTEAGRWRTDARIPLVVLRPDGKGGRTPLTPDGTPLSVGDVVLVLGPSPASPSA